MARKIEPKDETPEDRQRREALYASHQFDSWTSGGVRGRGRGRGRGRQASSTAPNPEYQQPQESIQRSMVDPITGETIYYEIEETSEDEPQASGSQSGFGQVIDPQSGETVSYSVEHLDDEPPQPSRRRRHSAGDQPIAPIPPYRGSVAEPQPRWKQTCEYRSAAERFRDPDTGEPDWDAMRAAIEDENRGRSESRADIPAVLAGKSRAESMAAKEYLYQRTQRQTNELRAQGYSGPERIPLGYRRWTRDRPAFDPNRRRELVPQVPGFDSRPSLRRTMSAPDLSAAERQKWTREMRNRRSFHTSRYLQGELDQRKVKQLMSTRTQVVKRNLKREERKQLVRNNAKMDVVIQVEDLSIDIHPIVEVDEEIDNLRHPYQRFYDEDDDEPPPYDGFSFTR